MRLASRNRISLLLAALAAGASTSSFAQAADRPSIDTRTFRPSTDPNASLVIEPAITPGAGVFSFGAYGRYELHPVTLRNPATVRPVEHAVGLDAVANLGIGQRLALGVLVPVMLYQTGAGGLPASVASTSRVPSTVLGDVGVNVKGTLVRNEQGGFGLAALGYVTAPTGNRESFFGEGAPTVTARIIAEYTLLVAVAQASLGYKLRTEHRTWPDAATGGVRFGDELPWSVGFALRPGVFGIDPGNRQRLEVAAHGWLPAGPAGPFGAGSPGNAALSPMQLAVSDRFELGRYRDAFLTVGAEIGLSSAVGIPLVRGIVGFGFSPRSHDADSDGVPDDLDGCPDIAEDRDGFEDNDGCPDIDNDDDGIVDREDACPNVKGTSSSVAAENGCPHAAPVAPAPAAPATPSPEPPAPPEPTPTP